MLDLRLPIGWLFLIFGALIAVYSRLSPTSTALGTLSFDLNLVWGIVMVVFGTLMILIAHTFKSE